MKFIVILIILSIGSIKGFDSFFLESIKNLSNIKTVEKRKRHFLEKDKLKSNLCDFDYHKKKQKIKSYDDVVLHIKSVVLNCPEFKSASYNRVAYLVDTFGPRLWGSEPLMDATNFMKEELIKEGFENVRLEENKNSLHWVRGKESLTLYSPRNYPTNIPMIGLGRSVGGNVKAEVLVVNSFDELEIKADEAKNKIVLFNVKWTKYEETVKYRAIGASKASKYGALACIIRSVSPVSIESPHTGAISYDETLPKIPAAAISLESADMFQRMSDRGQKIVLELKMEAHLEDEVSTYNVIGEIKGSEYPNEILLMGGHIDSWDVGPQTGANDDAAGFMVCMEAVRILLKLNLRPRRTIRFIAWSGEEFGHRNSGAPSYAKQHSNELKDHIIAFESDSGTTNILGWGFSGGKNGFEIFKEIHNTYLSNNLKMDKLVFGDGVMVDTTPLFEAGIPVVRNIIEDTPDSKNYFSVHHSAGDSVSVLSKEDMDKNSIAIASMFYILADLPKRFPRD
jgi:carboxypeptidase Q